MICESVNKEYYSVKSLLQEWNLSHLFPHFMAQKINVDILKIMKANHAAELLCDFTLGERIRFDYEFDKWRRSIGCPLNNKSESEITSNQSAAVPMPFISNVRGNVNDNSYNCGNNLQASSQWQNISTQTNIESPVIASSNEQQSLILRNNNYNPKCISTQTNIDSPVHIKLNENHSTPLNTTSCKPAKLAIRRTVPATLLTTQKRRRGHNISAKAARIPSKMNARLILEKCKPRGPELMQLYRINKTFHPAERSELINIFAKYFYNNGIHLTVTACYELDRQILRLFPGECLKDYRTAKRGKIYARLSYMKNRRRSRSNKPKTKLKVAKITENQTTNYDNEFPNTEETEMNFNENSKHFESMVLDENIDDLKLEINEDFDWSIKN